MALPHAGVGRPVARFDFFRGRFAGWPASLASRSRVRSVFRAAESRCPTVMSPSRFRQPQGCTLPALRFAVTLPAGDCFALRLDRPLSYHNPTRKPARYAVVLVQPGALPDRERT